jgi:hypothetical protein
LIRFANSAGDVIVEAWNRPEVEVTVLKWIDHEFAPEQIAGATQRLQAVSVNMEHPSAEELRISIVAAHVRPFGRKRRVEIKYHIYAPRDSRIEIDHRGGYILLSGLTGDIDVVSRRGDILLMLPNPTSYAIDARNRFGIVTPDFAGTTKHKYIIGEQFTRDHQPLAHHMRLRVGFAGITIKEVPPEGEAPASTSVK